MIEKKDLHKADIIVYRDRIFMSRLRDIVIVEKSRKLTSLFNEFIKGITYFDNEQVYSVREPVYHRRGSCVARGNINKECDGLITNAETSQEIEKCYIERLIYDKMWSEILGMQQDEGHLNWISQTKNAYRTCFPNRDIEVELPEFPQDYRSFNDLNNSHQKLVVPTQLIIRYYENGSLHSTETYTKTYNDVLNQYIYPVDCIKKIGQNIFIRSSNFDDNGHNWIAVGGKTIRKKRKTKFKV
jgi:hypothetical protein